MTRRPTTRRQNPPHDRGAERRLLAGLFRAPAASADAVFDHGVTEDDLFFHPHRLVWRAWWELVGCGADPTLANAYLALRAAGTLPDLGPNPALWLADLYDADPTGAWCRWACAAVRRAAARRRLAHRATELLAATLDGTLSDAEVAALAARVA